MKKFLLMFITAILCMPLMVNAQLTATFGTGTSATTTGGSAGAPMSYGGAYSWCQQIYRAAELTAANVPPGAVILSISFYNATGATTMSDIRTYMGHCTNDYFSGTSGWAPYNTLTLVDSGDWVAPAGWFDVNLDAPFVWDGTSNIVVGVSFRGAHSDYSTNNPNCGYQYTSQGSGNNAHIRRFSTTLSSCDPTSTEVANSVSPNRPNLMITYIVSGCASLTPSVANIGPYTADLSWFNFQQTVSSWDMVYGEAGTFDTLSGGLTVSNITDTFYNLTGLSAGTMYQVFLKPYCGTEVGSWSSPRTFTTLAACPTPVNLTLMSHTAEEATITWMPGATETSWEVACVPHGSPVYSGTPTVVYSTPYTITNLIDDTQYDIYVRAECGNGEYSYWTSAVTFTTDPYCTEPTNVTASQVQGTSALITWNSAPVGATGYTVGYSEAGQGNWTIVPSVTGTSFMISGLTTDTDYDVFVLTECNQGDADTIYTSFHTKACLVGGDLEIGNGTSTSSYFPEYCLYNYSYTQQIYLATELGGQSDISSISFNAESIANANRHLKIYLMHTSAASGDWLNATNAQLVYDSTPTLTTGWNTFNFTAPFQYNGTDNLAVIVIDATGSWSGTNYFYTHTTSQTLSHYIYQDDSPYSITTIPSSGSSSTSSSRNNVIFGVPCDNTSTCAPPNLYVSSHTDNSITVAWAPGNTESSWELEYSEDLSTWTSEGVVSTSPYTIDNLTSNTLYYIRLRAVCGGGDYSEWSSVSERTACADMATLPYLENFDSYSGATSTSVAVNNLPYCWSYLNEGTSSSYSGYPMIYASATYAASGSNSIRFYTYITSGTYDDQIAILPPIDTDVNPMNTLQIALDVRANSTSYMFNLDVGVMTDPTDRNTFVTLQTIQTQSTTYANYEIPFNQYTGTGKYIAIRAAQPTTGYNYGYVDNVRVELIPACPKPTNVTSSAVTTNSVTLGWNEVGNATSWVITYGPTGFTPGTSVAMTETVYTNPYTVTGLNSSTGYDFYVQSECGGGEYSSMSNVHTVATECDMITVLPLMENFDSYSGATSTSVSVNNLPYCWSNLNTGSSTSYSGYPIIYSSATYAASGNNAMRFYTYTTSGTYSDQVAILPAIDVNTFPMNTLQLSFDARQNSTSYTFTLVVGVMTDPTVATSFTPVQTVTVTSTSYNNFEVPLSSYTGTGSYIAIKAPQPTSGYNYGYVDNIVVDLAPLCAKPTNVMASNITADGAAIDWLPGGNETAWELVVVPAGMSITAGTTEPVSAHPYTLTNLNDNTPYDVYVRADCGTGTDYSTWSQVCHFTTTPLCSAPTNVEVSQVAGTSALVTWTPAIFGATGYTVSYTETGMGNWTTQSVTGSQYMLTGLTPETAYTLTITSECNEGTAPAVTKTFTTPCLYGGTAQIGNGTTTTYTLPLNNYYNYSYTQQIFLASELSGAATISNIAFEYSYSSPSTSKSNVSIYLGHTNKSTFSSASDTVNPANLQLVYTGPLNCQQGWNTFNFTTPFSYNGTDNLVIAIDDNSGSYNGSSYTFYAHDAGAVRSLYYYSDSYNMDPTNPGGTSASNSTTSNRTNIKISLPCDYTVTCIAPNVYIAGATESSLTIDWAAGNNESSWEMEISSDGTNWTSEGVVTTPPYTINNLVPGTTYSVRMRSVCGGGEFSSWSMVSGFTDCAAIATVPYVQNFDSYPGSTNTSMATNNLPFCWNYLNDGTSTSYSGYPIIYSSSTYAASGSNSMRFYTYTTSGTYDDQIAILPAVDVNTLPLNTLQLSFDARANTTSYPFNLVIGVMTDPTNKNTFMPVSTITTQTTTYANYEIPLSQYMGTGTYVAIKAPQPTANYNYGYVDNVRLELIPACPKPTNVSAANVTTNSVDLTWVENGSATSWIIEYGPAGFTLGTGTTDMATSIPHTISGLSASTNYDFYVRSDCGGGDTSNYSMGCTIPTACDAIDQLPYTEGFDTYGTGDPAYPLCWGKINTYSSNRPYVNATHYAGVGSLYFYAGTSGTYNIAITPPFDATIPVNTLQATFMYRGTYATDRMIVGVMTNPVDASTFTAVDTVYPDASYTSWVEREVNFGTYNGSGTYIAFKNEYHTTYCYGYIDNLVIDLMPSCPKPSQFHVTNTTSTSVTLDWLPNGSESSWTIAYGPTGFDPTSASATTVTANAHPFMVDNLTTATPYDFYVQADCGGGDVSNWAGPVAATPGSYNMPSTGNNTVTTCALVIYDNGGPNGDYSNSSDSYLTIYPETAGNLISIQGTSSTESGWDYLYIYDGAGTGGTLLGTYSGEGLTVPELISSTGPLTIHFTSDGSVSKPGWELTVACISNTCPAPTNLTVSNVGNTSATVSWTPVGNETSWIVEHKAASASTWTVATANTTSYTLSGLTALTAYQVRVKADCGSETSVYKTTSFTTPNCAAGDACQYTFVLGDGYGDGWNGGSLTVSQGGTTIATLEAVNHNLSSTQTYDTVVVNLCDNQSTTLGWYSGSFDDEVSVKVIGPDGSQVFYQLDLSTVSSTLYTFTSDCSGSTPVITDPTVATNAATGITQTAATLHATITNPDNVTITAKGFQWKTTQGGNYTSVNGTGTGNGFTADLSNLTPNTSYTYKAFITFNGQTVTGSEMTFTTSNQDVEPCDVPTGLHATDIQNESISFAWDANPNVNSWNIQYKPDGGTLSSATANTNSYTITGLIGDTDYEIQVQANCGNGNVSDWSPKIIVHTTNVGIENHLTNSVVLFPNPAKEVVNVQCTMYNVQSLEVFDVFGKRINTVNVIDNPTCIDVSTLANGMYFVRVTTEQGVVTKSFVKR